jgi:tetratricopeptide (TPR) repeat protein
MEHEDNNLADNALSLEQEEAEEAATRPVQDWFMMGVNAYVHGAYDEAIVYFDAAIDKDPTDARNYVNRGDVYRDKGDYDEAFNDYTMAIHLGSPQAQEILDEFLAEMKYTSHHSEELTKINDA